MNLSAGTLLISAPSLEDPNFQKVVICIAEHNSNGALGFVLNKVFSRRFNELVEFNASLPFELYEGGPVEKEALYFLHRRPDIISSGEKVTGEIFMGGNFKTAVLKMNEGSLTADHIKLFLGYCGWNNGELEAEIADGSWLMVTASPGIVFTTNTTTLWEDVYQQISQ